MKTLVLFDSQYGNTQKIAEAIGKGINGADVKHISEIAVTELANYELVIVGSPTQGFRPTKTLEEYLNKLPAGALNRVKVAAFDTRFAKDKMPALMLKVMVKFFDESIFAAKHIGQLLQKKGAKMVNTPEGFIVGDMKGPLADGELQRAEKWGYNLAKI